MRTIKLAVAVVFLSLALAGCAAQMRAQERQAAWDRAVAELNAQNDRALSGRQTWAQMYQNMNQYGYQQQNKIVQEALVSGAATMMPFARARDAGQISQEQLSDVQMYVGAQLTAWVNRRIEQEEQSIRAQEAAESARLSNALAAVYLGSAVAAPQRYAPTNCLSSKVGNFYSTNCR